MDPDSAWWAKLNHAGEHLTALRTRVDDFRRSNPYSLSPEPTETPGRLAYRLKFLRPFPVAISTTVGDVLHNQRAALESLAFELATRGHGGTLTAAQERASTFPICRTPDAFDRFFAAKTRVGLYDERARKALRRVQPFTQLEEAHRLGVARDKTFAEEYQWDELHRLDVLWNIDKHRRLTLIAWWPDLIYWGSNGPTNRRALPGDGTLSDGSILLYIEGNDEGQGIELNHDFNIVLTDDPAFDRSLDVTRDLIGLLERWHWHIANVVFPTVFAAMPA
jgi:hypothetical protein